MRSTKTPGAGLSARTTAGEVEEVAVEGELDKELGEERSGIERVVGETGGVVAFGTTSAAGDDGVPEGEFVAGVGASRRGTWTGA